MLYAYGRPADLIKIHTNQLEWKMKSAISLRALDLLDLPHVHICRALLQGAPLK